jgi:hypothetical protein
MSLPQKNQGITAVTAFFDDFMKQLPSLNLFLEYLNKKTHQKPKNNILYGSTFS